MSHHNTDYIEKAKDLFPAIQKFTEWFLAGNQFGIENELYETLQENLISILQDMQTALEESDRVLMLDALEHGISEYLRMFLPEQYFEEMKEKVNESTV